MTKLGHATAVVATNKITQLKIMYNYATISGYSSIKRYNMADPKTFTL